MPRVELDPPVRRVQGGQTGWDPPDSEAHWVRLRVLPVSQVLLETRAPRGLCSEVPRGTSDPPAERGPRVSPGMLEERQALRGLKDRPDQLARRGSLKGLDSRVRRGTPGLHPLGRQVQRDRMARPEIQGRLA